MSSIRGDKRLDLGKFVIASIRIKGTDFEILVDPDRAWDVKKKIRQLEKEGAKESGEAHKVTVDELLSASPTPMEEIIEGFIVFENLKRGEKISDDKLVEAFGSDDIVRITAHILLHGDLQLTKDQRDKFIEEKRRKLIDLLAKNCINPQTKKPHPPSRIERALEEASVAIDPFLAAEEQAPDIVKALKPVIPIKMERVVLTLLVPAEFTGKAYNVINSMGSISEENWKNTGALECKVELPSGMQAEFLDKLMKISHGRVTAKVIERISM